METPRIWRPAVRCPECAYPNDASFRFCQQCGYSRKKLRPASAPLGTSFDLALLDDRLDSLSSTSDNKQYNKQRNSLRKELEGFLASLPARKDLLSASPKDISRFLVWKDRGGRTKLHSPSCVHFGTPKGKTPPACSCPKRLAVGTVDCLIGKLRSIFIDAGRGDSWNNLLGIGNPAAHPSVRSYLRSIREEQAQARVEPKQAVPFFFHKLQTLCRHLRAAVFAPSPSPVQRFTAARDLAFFCVEFYSGDRASDLGRVLTKEVSSLPQRAGFLFHHTFGKTLRGGNSNTFMVKKCQDGVICPVSNLELYVRLCDLMQINLRDGYLFRSLNSRGEVSNSPFIGSAVANRLTRHLQATGIHDGETMHSFRSGCSITLSMLGVPPEEVASHVGWRSLDSFKYYCQTDKVLGLNHAASVLADSTSVRPDDPEPQAAAVGHMYSAHNSLNGLSPAFPWLHALLRLLSVSFTFIYFLSFGRSPIAQPLSMSFSLWTFNVPALSSLTPANKA